MRGGPSPMSTAAYTRDLTMNLTGNVAQVKRSLELNIGDKIEELLRIVRKLETQADIQARNINFMGEELRKNTDEILSLRSSKPLAPKEATHELPQRPPPPAIPNTLSRRPPTRISRIDQQGGSIHKPKEIAET
jgi:hypothetical protein